MTLYCYVCHRVDDPAKPSRRGTFGSVNALVFTVRDYITHWKAGAMPFVWTATAGEILAQVAWVQTNVKKLVGNNAK
jgi:hypothetical protein